jgi:hypothetical protein
MSWLDRLRGELTLTSPDGNVFTPLWRGNPRTIGKKLGIFEFPKVRGAIVQDLDVGAFRYSISLFFDGEDNDLEAQRFSDAVQENGVWAVTHPIYGDRLWQLMSATINDVPMESGNLTRIETEWIEPLDLEILPSPAQLAGILDSNAGDLTETAADQLEGIADQSTASGLAALKGAVEDVVSVFENTLQSISDVSAAISSEIAAIKRGIDAVLQVVPLDVIAVAGQIQALIELPGRAIEDVNARLGAYENFAAGIIGGIGHETANAEGRNRVGVKELALTASISAVSRIAATGNLTSRTEAIEAIEGILTLFNDIIDDLDVSQEAFEDNPITTQYFSQSTSFPLTALIVAQAVALILISTFDLAVEKRFTLQTPRAPVEIAMTEYDDISPEMLDFFITTNGLKANDILILPAGREVVVYV